MSSPTCHGYGAVASGGKRESEVPTAGQVILATSAGRCQRATFNWATCWYSMSVSPRPRAADRNKSRTAQHKLRQLVSSGKPPDHLRPPSDVLKRAHRDD